MPSLSFYFKKGHFLHNIMVTMDFKNRPPWNFRNRKNIPCTSLSLLFLPCSYHFPALWHTFGWNAQSFLSLNSWTLTDTWPLIITSSEKRTLTGLDFNLAFFAALIKADLGDWKGKWWQNISHTFKLKPLSFFFTFLVHWELHTYSNTLQTVHWRMEMQFNHNASQDNTYVHTYSQWYTSCSEKYPTVRLERWEGLSVHIQFHVVLSWQLLWTKLTFFFDLTLIYYFGITWDPSVQPLETNLSAWEEFD